MRTLVAALTAAFLVELAFLYRTPEIVRVPVVVEVPVPWRDPVLVTIREPAPASASASDPAPAPLARHARPARPTTIDNPCKNNPDPLCGITPPKAP